MTSHLSCCRHFLRVSELIHRLHRIFSKGHLFLQWTQSVSQPTPERGGRRRVSKQIGERGPGVFWWFRPISIYRCVRFPQRTCFGSNSRRWKEFGFVFCRLSVVLIFSASRCQFGPRLFVSFSFSFSFAVILFGMYEYQGTENKNGCGLGSSSFSQVLRIKKKNMS